MMQGQPQPGDKPSFIPLALATPRIRRRDLAGGGFLLESEEPLGDYAAHAGLLLQQHAQARPDALFLAERNGGAAGASCATASPGTRPAASPRP